MIGLFTLLLEFNVDPSRRTGHWPSFRRLSPSSRRVDVETESVSLHASQRVDHVSLSL